MRSQETIKRIKFIIDEQYKSEESRFTCQDCKNYDYNMYMVNDEIWNKFGNKDGTLCMKCLEKRMGRKLIKKDFEQYKNAKANLNNPEVQKIIKIKNLNEQLSRIKQMMGLLTEQQACETWKDGTFVNGDGIKTPKITINNDNKKIEGIYQGPETGFCIQSAKGNKYDSIHQLATITVYHEGSKKHLKNLYNSGVYVRPDLKNIVLDRRKNYYRITIPLIPTTEDKAITSINQRGSMGGGTGGIDYTEFNSVKNTYPEMFYDEIKTGGDMTEHFFAFRNLRDYPIKTQSGGQKQTQQGSQSQQKTYVITAPTFYDLWKKSKTQEFQNISIDENSFAFDINTKKITFKSGNTPIKSMSFIFDDQGDLETRLETLKTQNSTMKVRKQDLEGPIQWAILTF